MRIGGRTAAALGVAMVLWLAAEPSDWARAESAPPTASTIPILDTHAHPGRNRRGNLFRSTSLALDRMERYGIAYAILLPPPFPSEPRERYGARDLASIAKEHPGRLSFAAGGESINVLIMSTPAASVTPSTTAQLVDDADAISRSGAVGIGEIAIEHLSSGRSGHPYESVPANHPLLFALVDAAARLNRPVDIHMEAVPTEGQPLGRLAGSNPPTLPANIADFERLLDHNPAARIIWAHAGWDLTLERTVSLMHGLLERHSNLFMSFKIQSRGPQRNSPLTQSGSIKPEWLALLRAFPDRFVIGTDQFYDDDDDDRMAGARRLVDALPTDLAVAVAHENAERIYHLNPLKPSAAAQR